MAEMSSIEINVPLDGAFSRSRSGTVWGPIYLSFGGDFFPAKGWTDIVFAFLSNWLDALLSLLDAQRGERVVRFYDGPFEVQISMIDKGCTRLSLSHRGSLEFVVEASIEGLIRNAVEVASAILDECFRRGWAGDDTNALATFIEQARRTLPKSN